MTVAGAARLAALVAAVWVAGALGASMAQEPLTVYCWRGGGWAGFSQRVWKAPNYLGHEVVKSDCDGALPT